MNLDLVEQIRSVQFTPVRFREGYAMDEVDDLLDHLAVAVEHGRPVRPLVDAARFTPVRFREGYWRSEVDDFLARIADDVAARQGGA